MDEVLLGQSGGRRFAMELAGFVVVIDALYSDIVRLCDEYRVPDDDPRLRAPDLAIETTPRAIESERRRASAEQEWTDGYLETLWVLRCVANWLPHRKAALAHAAVVSYCGKAYAFMAPSGTGKSTHIKLWRSHIGPAVGIVNGDKPFIACDAFGCALPRVFGTPWAGKEHWQKKCDMPLAGICVLSRAEPGKSRIRRLSPQEAIDSVLWHLYLPPDEAALGKTLEVLDCLVRNVPVFAFEADMSFDAVKTSFEAMTGVSVPLADA